MEPLPDYIQHRINIFEELHSQYEEDIAKKPRDKIEITLDNNRIEIATAWETTPAQIARQISKSLFERVVIAKVNGVLWDLERPFEESARLELLEFQHPEGKMVFWHSSAHVLGEAAERRFGCHLCNGPPVDDGFYYDMALPEGYVLRSWSYKNSADRELALTFNHTTGRLSRPLRARRSKTSSLSCDWSCPKRSFWRCSKGTSTRFTSSTTRSRTEPIPPFIAAVH